ncbi:MAG: T9SS type A sorting domain-containing protein, partial [Cyclobacteriaceae bacterium]
LWKYGENVDISATIGEKPPTYNVAVLNGLDSLGIPYDIDENDISPVDSLISQPIDLTQVPVNKRNTVFMSFFWQANGFGEIPDLNDSLSLSFLDADSNWVSQNINPGSIRNNALTGGPDILRFSPVNPEEQIFTQTILQVEAEFFHENFRFKFQSFGSSQGPFDSWLIDYIYINFDRDRFDLNHDDRAISKGLDINFAGYQAIPFDHFFNNELIEDQSFNFTLSSLDRFVQPVKYSVEVFDADSGTKLVTVDDAINVDPLLSGGEIRNFISSTVDPDDVIIDDDTTNLRLKLFLDSDDDEFVPNASTYFSFRANDTVYTDLKLERYYAYDDGSAEFTAGVNVSGSQLVVKYGIISRDTLTHIDINFPVLFPDSERQRLRVLVMRDLTDDPGSTLIRQSIIVPQRVTSNEFTRIKLLEQYVLEDSIFIGIEQSSSTYVPIGLDKNTQNGSKIFFKLGDNWERNNAVEGSLMIRPVFGEPFAPTETTELTEARFEVYPNPTNGILNIVGDFDEFTIVDLTGKSVAYYPTDNDHIIDVNHLDSGLYLVRFRKNDVFTTRRFIKH